MAAQFRTIKPSGSGSPDAVSCNAFMLLVAAATNTTDQWEGQYQDTTTDTTASSSAGITLGSGGSVQVTVRAAERGNGVKGAGAKLLYSGASIAFGTGAAAGTVSDLEIGSTGTGSYIIGNASGAGWTFNRCFTWAQNSGSGTARIGISQGAWKFYNSVLAVNTTATTGNFNGIQNFSGTVSNLKCYNFTTILTLKSGNSGAGFVSCEVQNCMGGNGDGHASNGYFATCTAIGNGYNLQTYNSAAPGANEWHNIQLSTLLASVTAGSEQPLWSSYATMINYAGADASGTIGNSLSFENNTRLSTWYIGASYKYPAAPTWTTSATLPTAEVGAAYSTNIVASGTGTLTITKNSGSYGGGLSFVDNGNSTGTISGTPNSATDGDPNMRVTDAWGQYADRAFTLPIIDPDIVIRRDTAGGTIIAYNGTIAFGEVAIGTPSSYVDVFVLNTGSDLLTTGTPTLAGGDAAHFQLDLTGYDTTIDPAANSSFKVRCNPTTSGAKTATITFTHDDGEQTSPFVINLTSTAVNPASGGMGSHPRARHH